MKKKTTKNNKLSLHTIILLRTVHSIQSVTKILSSCISGSFHKYYYDVLLQHLFRNKYFLIFLSDVCWFVFHPIPIWYFDFTFDLQLNSFYIVSMTHNVHCYYLNDNYYYRCAHCFQKSLWQQVLLQNPMFQHIILSFFMATSLSKEYYLLREQIGSSNWLNA